MGSIKQYFADLRRASTATLCTQLYRQGIRQPYLVGIRPLGSDTVSFVGEAYTMRFIPSREDIEPIGSDPYTVGNTLQWEAIEGVGEGEVLVVDSMEDTTAASAGDILLTRAGLRGAVAFVTDGALRDGNTIAEMELPAFARSVTGTTRPAAFHVADLQVPIACAGVAVYPGDVLVGDVDGVVVVPRSLVPVIAGPAAAQEELEQWLQKKVKEGRELWGTYPPSEKTLEEFNCEQVPYSRGQERRE